VALVTGASSGLGLAVAEALHAAGWTVAGASRRGTGGAGWRHDRVDVDDERAVREWVAEVAGACGRLDAVVCNAGWGLAGSVESTSPAEARAQFDTNFWGTVNVVQAALGHLRVARGRVVVMSSVAGALGIPFQAMYAASKFALEGWAESLWWEVEPFGVRVSLVQPGNVRTGFTDARRRVADDDAGPYCDAARRALTRMVHDERNGADPQRVADVVVALLERDRPPLRVPVGSVGERSGLWAKRLLPHRVFVRIARDALCG
jgi:NAD(P)-dependent dehydrogenase (short-subunit alcohol dehydrogenase family)